MMNEPIETVEHGNYLARIYADEFLENPREWSELGEYHRFEKGYISPDEKRLGKPKSAVAAMVEFLGDHESDETIARTYAKRVGWRAALALCRDTGCYDLCDAIGDRYVDPDLDVLVDIANTLGHYVDATHWHVFALSRTEIQDEWSGDSERAQKCADAIMEEYRAWANGECYRIEVHAITERDEYGDPVTDDMDDMDPVDSCCGFIGYDRAKEGAREMIADLISADEKRAASLAEYDEIEAALSAASLT